MPKSSKPLTNETACVQLSVHTQNICWSRSSTRKNNARSSTQRGRAIVLGVLVAIAWYFGAFGGGVTATYAATIGDSEVKGHTDSAYGNTDGDWHRRVADRNGELSW